MFQQGIYASPLSILPNRDRPSETIKDSSRLWLIEFDVEGIGKGCGVCKAFNAEEAVKLLKAQGIYNGSSYLYKVIRIEEIIELPCNALMAESVITLEAIKNSE